MSSFIHLQIKIFSELSVQGFNGKSQRYPEPKNLNSQNINGAKYDFGVQLLISISRTS